MSNGGTYESYRELPKVMRRTKSLRYSLRELVHTSIPPSTKQSPQAIDTDNASFYTSTTAPSISSTPKPLAKMPEMQIDRNSHAFDVLGNPGIFPGSSLPPKKRRYDFQDNHVHVPNVKIPKNESQDDNLYRHLELNSPELRNWFYPGSPSTVARAYLPRYFPRTPPEYYFPSPVARGYPHMAADPNLNSVTEMPFNNSNEKASNSAHVFYPHRSTAKNEENVQPPDPIHDAVGQFAPLEKSEATNFDKTSAENEQSTNPVSYFHIAPGGASKRVRKKCSAINCQNGVVQGGVCISHGARRKKCSHPRCMANVKRFGLCSTHGPARKRCEVNGCGKVAVRGGVCVTHGAKKKRCSEPGCTKKSMVTGMCKQHDMQNRSDDDAVSYLECTIKGCKNYGFRDGLCENHHGEFKLCVELDDFVPLSMDSDESVTEEYVREYCSVVKSRLSE